VKEESDESSDMNDSQMQPMELTMNTPQNANPEHHHPRHHEFSEPISLPPHSHVSSILLLQVLFLM
jgi:hypothetical protein